MGFSLRKFARGFSESMAETGRAQIKANLLEQRERRLAQQRADERKEERDFQQQRDKENRDFQREQNRMTRELQGERIDMEERRLKLAEEKAKLDAELGRARQENDEARTEALLRTQELQQEVASMEIDDTKARREALSKVYDAEAPEARQAAMDAYLIRMGKDPEAFTYKTVEDEMGNKAIAVLKGGSIVGSVGLEDGRIQMSAPPIDPSTLETVEEVEAAAKSGAISPMEAFSRKKEIEKGGSTQMRNPSAGAMGILRGPTV